MANTFQSPDVLLHFPMLGRRIAVVPVVVEHIVAVAGNSRQRQVGFATFSVVV